MSNTAEKSYYPVEVQCRTILACCLLYNLINREMKNFEIPDDIGEADSTHATIVDDDIHYIETSTSGVSGGISLQMKCLVTGSCITSRIISVPLLKDEPSFFFFSNVLIT